MRRRWAAVEARALGYGGATLVAEATGLSLLTIRRGLRELDRGVPPQATRQREAGAGRPARVVKDPQLLRDLDALVDPRIRDEGGEQNLERSTSGPWRVTPEAAELLEALVPACAVGKPKLLVTSTAAFQVPDGQERALAFAPLGSFEPAAVRKLWMRGQTSNELASVSDLSNAMDELDDLL